MQYDLILWFCMFTLWWFNRASCTTSLPIIILSSNLISLLLFNLPDSYTYYYLEGLRHTITLYLIGLLYLRERYTNYYSMYFLVYLSLILLFILSLFDVLSNIDIDKIGVLLNMLELMVFIYGILFLKSDNSCLSDR